MNRQFSPASIPPSTILKDLTGFLKFIDDAHLEIKGDKGLLPNHCLRDLNAQMSHSLTLDLEREQQISFPHISVIYLMARTLGLIEVKQVGSKRFLSTHETALESWRRLNKTEEYFNLMQTWLLMADHELINKGKSSWRGTFNEVIFFLQNRLSTPYSTSRLERSREATLWYRAT